MQEENKQNVLIHPAMDEGDLIKEKENNPLSLGQTLINPFMVKDPPKLKKDLFSVSFHRDEQKENEIIQRKKIDLSPVPLSLRKIQSLLPKENSSKEKNNQKDTRDNSDFDIDIMSESSGFNKIQKEKEFDINNLKINLGRPKNEDEDNIDEINLSNDDSEENKENSLSNNSIIDLTEGQNELIQNEENSKDELNEKDKDFTPGEKKKKKIHKSRFLRGHCPFNFFEKEKCKNMDFKKINIRTYISQISAQWKLMSDKEKEPYVKLSEEFKKKFLSNNNIDEDEIPKLINKKRKRKKKNINSSTNLNLGYNNIKKEGENIINNNNSLDNFSIYTTNKYIKKRNNNINNNIKEKNNIENKYGENESSSGVQQTVEKSENEKKENNNNELNIFNDICDKFKALKCISENEINEYIKTILLPFVLKSLEFLNGIN